MSWCEAAVRLPIHVTQAAPSGYTLDAQRLAAINAAATGRIVSAYQITIATLDRMRDDALFLPCPPVTRGEEVSTEAMSSPRLANVDAKRELLHVQNAVLELTVGRTPTGQFTVASRDGR